jgi:SSS family solute:Na+ symporter
MEPWVVSSALIFGYLVFSLALGWLAHRQLSVNLEDFLLYGRKAGFIVLYLTIVATYHSAFAFLGSCGFFYTHGIGFWDAGAWTILAGIITYVFGTRIWALGKRFGYITPADMLADFYESETVRSLTALISVGFTILYIQVQSQGLGYILSTASGDRIPYPVATGILLVVAAVYLIAGGLRAVYWTDVLQGVWMYLAIWIGALILTFKLFGGPVALWQQVAALRPDLLTLPGPKGFFTYSMWSSLIIIFSFGVIFQPHILIRYYTAVDGKTLKWLGATTPIYLMTLFIPTALIGLGGALVMPDIATPDRIFPELLFQYAPPWITGMILAGATAAAMSTLDSILHANMTVLTRDVYQRYINPEADQKHYVLVGRLIVVALLLVGYALSIYKAQFLVILVALSGAGSLQLAPALIGALFPSRFLFTAKGITFGLIASLITLYYTLVLNPHPLTIHGGIWALAVNFVVAIFVSKSTASPSPQTVQRIHGAVEEFVHGKS